MEEFDPENTVDPHEYFPDAHTRANWICKNDPTHKWVATDIDTALEMIKQFINIQKEAGYSVVKNRCHLYLNLSSPDKKACVLNPEDYVVTDEKIVNENDLYAKEAMDKGKKAVVEFLRKYLALPARYEEEIKKASGYLQNAIDRGYSTKDKWEAEIEKSKTELRKIEANIPIYRDILTTILQEPERLKFLAKTRIEQSRWNVREKYMDVFPYIQCGDIWIGFINAHSGYYSWVSAMKPFRNEPCEIDNKHSTFVRKNTNVPYMEAHHLVPLAYSELFTYSLDVEENIISLCSTCHNQIHYGKDAELLIRKLYARRKKLLRKAGIVLSEQELLEMYGIV